MKDIYKHHTAKFVHMQQNNKTPNILKSFFIANQTVHLHNTRQNHNLHINQLNTNNGKRSMKYHGATIWNALAGSIRKIESNKTYKACWPITKTKYLDVTFQTDNLFIQFILVLNFIFIDVFFSVFFLVTHLCSISYLLFHEPILSVTDSSWMNDY